MIKVFRQTVFAVLAGHLTLSLTRADEGFWLHDRPPRQILNDKYQYDLTDKLIERLEKSTIHMAKRGSGAFVSADGLLLTNHHVALAWLEKLAITEKISIEQGFHAKKRDDELSCPGLELFILWSTENVTARVLGNIKSEMTLAEAFRARQSANSDLEKESWEKTGLVSEVTELYHGGEYLLYRYRKYSDVRLVFAPGRSRLEFLLAAPPGSPDSEDIGMYVTSVFDVCFFRAYENGKAIQCEHYLKIANSSPELMDLVLATGYPVCTNRFRTAAELDVMYGSETLIPAKAALRQLIVLEEFAKENPKELSTFNKEAALYRNRPVTSFEFVEKHLFALRRSEKVEYAHLLGIDGKLAARQRQALATIESANRASATNYPRWFFLEGGGAFRGELFRFARYIVRKAEEPTMASLTSSRPRDRVAIWREGFFDAKPISKRLEIAKLADSLAMFASEAGEDADLVDKVLVGKSPEVRAAELVNGTSLDDISVRVALLKGGNKALTESKDPMLALAQLVETRANQVVGLFDTQITEPSRQAYTALHQIRRERAAILNYPDATNTLRLSFGRVVSTSDTLNRLFVDCKLPMSWQAAKNLMNLDLPLSLRVSADCAPGNSGSPIVDVQGRVVGLVSRAASDPFGVDLAYNSKLSTFAVSTSGMVELLEKVYGASTLVTELIDMTTSAVAQENPRAFAYSPKRQFKIR